MYQAFSNFNQFFVLYLGNSHIISSLLTDLYNLDSKLAQNC